MDRHLLSEDNGASYQTSSNNNNNGGNSAWIGETNPEEEGDYYEDYGSMDQQQQRIRSDIRPEERDPDWQLMRMLSGFSPWETPVFDYANWVAIGVYLFLMCLIPWVKQGSNSIVWGANVIIFLLYVYWYSWFANCTKNDAVKYLSSGFYLGGLVSFIVAVIAYFYMGVPTVVYVYQPYFSTPYQPTYQVVLECFIVAFVFTGLLQEGLKYWLLVKNNLEYLAFDDRIATNQIIGGSIGLGLGAVLCTLSLSLMIFDMSWISRVELWVLSVCWQIPLTICTSYIVGAGIADREVLQLETTTFAILCMPIFYTSLAYFQVFLIIGLHPSIFVRLLAFLGCAVLNLILLSAATLDVWQRNSMMKTKQRLRARQIVSNSIANH